MTKQQLSKMTKEDILAHYDLGWSIVNYEFQKTKSLTENVLGNECAYAYIKHDMDKKADGTLKEPHCHLLLLFPFEKSGQQVYDMCMANYEQNVMLEPIVNRRIAYEYLTHKNEKDPLKWHYHSSDIVCNNNSIFTYQKASNKSCKPNKEEFVKDLLECKLHPREMAYKYGRDYIKNYKAYNEFIHYVATVEDSITDIAWDMELNCYRVYRGTDVTCDMYGNTLPPEFVNSKVFTLALQIAHDHIKKMESREEQCLLKNNVFKTQTVK